MGFFLSKLLPQLIYPLGLGLLLQLIAIGGRKRRWALPLSITGWLVIAIPAMPVVSDALLKQLEDQAASLTPQTIPHADAVLVLGGGIRPEPTKGLGVEVNEAGDRLLCGLRLWKENKAPLLITSGARVSFGPKESAEIATLIRRLDHLDGEVLEHASVTHMVLSCPYRTPFTMLLTLVGHKTLTNLFTVPWRVLRKRLFHDADIPTIDYLQHLHLGILAEAMERAAVLASRGARKAQVLVKPFVMANKLFVLLDLFHLLKLGLRLRIVHIVALSDLFKQILLIFIPRRFSYVVIKLHV